MPENEQQNDAQETEATVEETEETTDATENDGDVGTNEGADDDKPQEGKPKADEFDAKRAQEKIRKANSEAANLRKRLKDLEPLAKRAKELEDAQKTEAERLQDQLKAAQDRAAAFRARAVKSEVRALAAGTFADATDPEAHLTLSDYVDDDGEIDTARIEADLAELLERKPHLGKPKAEPEKRRPAPDLSQASGANKQRKSADPAEEFAGFIQSRLGRR
jgi:hypothetical protein